MLQQVPIPPVVVEAPIPPVVMDGPPEWVGIVAMASVIGFFVVMFPLARALARRLDGGHRAAAPELQGEIDQLHARLAEMEQLQHRVLELENRVEFSERLLTQQRDLQLPGPGGSA